MARYEIRGLDMAGDTPEELVRFLMFARREQVDVRFTSARGPNGYPMADLYSHSLYDMSSVLLYYCDNDALAVADLMEMVARVTD